MEFDIEMDNEITEYEQMRTQNMKQFAAMISEWQDDIDESFKDISEHTQKQNFKKRKSKVDPTFLFAGAIPYERRRSDRLLNVTPKYSYEDLIDEEDVKHENRYSDDIDDLEKVVFRKRKSFVRKSAGSVYVPVEEITEKYLNKVATKVTVKVYNSEHGTSCHQCRQKTLDSKTYCRSGRCIGVRGQFCGVCLKNRYGENAKEALLNSKWECPPCRGLCNCSICRTREGKRPTGILAPIAFQHGHKSVKHFLLSLNGEGDYVNETPEKTKKNKYEHDKYKEDFQDVIGFNKDLKLMLVLKSKSLTFNDDQNDLVGFNKDKEPIVVAL